MSNKVTCDYLDPPGRPPVQRGDVIVAKCNALSTHAVFAGDKLIVVQGCKPNEGLKLVDFEFGQLIDFSTDLIYQVVPVGAIVTIKVGDREDE